MTVYTKKAIKRIPLHAGGYMGPVGTTSYILWVAGVHHYLLIPAILGTIAAFLKEVIENVTITQVWSEFWIDAFAQVFGTMLGILAMKLIT